MIDLKSHSTFQIEDRDYLSLLYSNIRWCRENLVETKEKELRYECERLSTRNWLKSASDKKQGRLYMYWKSNVSIHVNISAVCFGGQSYAVDSKWKGIPSWLSFKSQTFPIFNNMNNDQTKAFNVQYERQCDYRYMRNHQWPIFYK